MLKSISRSIVFLMLSCISFSFTTVVSAEGLDFQLVPMHYDFLKGKTREQSANDDGYHSYPLLNNANKGDTQIQLDKGEKLNPEELIVYKTTSGKYIVGEVESITGNTISLKDPLKDAVYAGSNVWNFYNNDNHPNEAGYRALGDFALDKLTTTDFAGKVHAFAGDSWFDNSFNIPHLATKLGASQIINKAVGGRTTVDVLNNFDTDFPANAAVQPDYIWVILGTNDYYEPIARADYINNLEQIIQKINALGAQAIVYTSSVGVTIPTEFDSTYYFRLSNDYADDLLALKSGNQGTNGKIKAYNQSGHTDNLVIEFTPTKVLSNDAHYFYFIDTDNKSETGYRAISTWANAAGADYMIKDDRIFKSLNNVSNFDDATWEDIGPVISSTGKKIVLAKTDIGLSLTEHTATIKVGILVKSNDESTIEDHYPKQDDMKELAVIAAQELKANNDTATVETGKTVIIDVLANDTGDGRTIYEVDETWDGAISVKNGKLEYIADGTYIGDVVVWYGITDPNGGDSWASVTITITDNLAVVLKANDDSVTVEKGKTVLINALVNDTGNNISIYEVDDVWTGSISIQNGQLKYESDGNYIGNLTVWYGIQDLSGHDSWAKVTITITSKATILKAHNDTVTVKQGKKNYVDVLDNDEGDNPYIYEVDDVWTGKISIKKGKLKYKSDPNFEGELIVWYGITDSSGDTSWASLTINVVN